MTSDAREELFARARESSTDQGTWAEAERQWVEVIDAYRTAPSADEGADTHRRQMLARSLWRYAMLLTMRGRAVEALTPAREAVRIFVRVDATVAAGHTAVGDRARDEALAELITAMVDLGEILFAADDRRGRLKTLDEALKAGLRAGPPPTAGPLTRRAMGTGYHNLAVALTNTRLPGLSPDQAREAALAASRAVELRQSLIDPADAMTGWELANSYLVFTQRLVLIEDVDRAGMVVKLARALIEVLEPAGGDLTDQLRETSSLVAAARITAQRHRWKR